MTLERVQRIKWRLEELHKEIIDLKDFRKAVMYEAGTHDITIIRYIKIMKELGYIKRINRCQFKLIT